jgi:hypothetical protein
MCRGKSPRRLLKAMRRHTQQVSFSHYEYREVKNSVGCHSLSSSVQTSIHFQSQLIVIHKISEEQR